MGFAKRFVEKFWALFVCLLSCFDRVIFKGHLPFGGDDHLNNYVDYVLRMKRKDFLPWLEQHSQTLVEHAQALAKRLGRPYEYRQGRFRKEAFIQELIRRDNLDVGLVAVLCVQETCRSVQLRYGQGRPRLVFALRPQRVLYYYWLDANFGLMYVRLQTWFPYVTQVYVNGHSWLAQQLRQWGIGFQQRDNAFVALDDPARAQQLADKFAQLPWVKQLTRWARQVNPLLTRGGWLSGMSYYWVTDQAEYSTDVLFRSRDQLRELYPRLLDHAVVNFSARDILMFLGRKLTGNFQGEVLSDLKKGRHPGARIKHRMKDNWLKMYDKFGLILRVETVINRPREFSIHRTRFHRDGTSSQGFFPMNKDTASLIHYQEQALACNRRYLDALAVVDDPTPAYQQLRQLTEPKVTAGRSYAGFNPARREDVRLFTAILEGDHIARGFRNKDIRAVLFGPDAKATPRESAAVGRLVKRLHTRQLVAKIPRTRRWRVTQSGRHLLSLAVQLYHQSWPELMAA